MYLVMDADYLQSSLGNILDLCLAEVVQKKPWDPIEFMSQWLYKHKENISQKAVVCCGPVHFYTFRKLC